MKNYRLIIISINNLNRMAHFIKYVKFFNYDFVKLHAELSISTTEMSMSNSTNNNGGLIWFYINMQLFVFLRNFMWLLFHLMNTCTFIGFAFRLRHIYFLEMTSFFTCLGSTIAYNIKERKTIFFLFGNQRERMKITNSLFSRNTATKLVVSTV